MNIEIKSRFTGEVIQEGEYESIKECLEKNRGADLGCAYLGGAYLVGAKNYKDSHDVFAEIIRRLKTTVFVDVEWSAIAQITIHRLCWDSIKKRFFDVMPHIFQVLADAGFKEWQEYWEKQIEEEKR